MNMESKRLHLGSGEKKLEGWINVDINPRMKPDIVWDLENGTPAEIQMNTISEVRACHVLEHIRTRPKLMQDIHDVCVDGAKVFIQVPEAPSHYAFSDPTHVRFFTPETFDYWADVRWIYRYPHFRILGMKNEADGSNLTVMLEVVKKLTKERVVDEIMRTQMNGPELPKGISYGELPEELGKLPCYRPNKSRLEFIDKHLTESSWITDLGCNAGHMCFALQKLGHRCNGVDSDWEAIKTAKLINDFLGVKNFFFNQDITEYKNKSKVVLYLSAFQWVVQKHGLDVAAQHLKELAKSPCELLFFETAGSDSKAPLRQADDQLWIVDMLKSCGWHCINSSKISAETGGDRYIYALNKKNN